MHNIVLHISIYLFPWLHVLSDLSPINPIRSGVFQTDNFPGGGFKSPPPPPYDLENYCINFHHIINLHVTKCFRHVPIRIFQKFAIFTILQRFQNIK